MTLEWFVQNREIVVGAVKADSIILTSSATLSKAVETALEIAFDEQTNTVDGEFGLDFKQDKLKEGGVKIIANDVFFATRSTSLYAKECTISYSNLYPEIWYEVCGYRFKFTVMESTPEQYTLRIQPKIGDTSKFIEEFDMRKMRVLDELHLVGILLYKSSNSYVGEITTWLVGPYGTDMGGNL